MIKLTYFNVDWLRIKNRCRTTINKGDSAIQPSEKWKKQLILAEHSPLRLGNITVRFDKIPYFVSTHLVRHHIGVEKFVGTSRSDRTGVPREERRQTDDVQMELDMNPQALINISRKRLCAQADPTTRAYWNEVVEEVRKEDETLAWGCVPECIRDGGCPEFTSCGLYAQFSKKNEDADLSNMMERYDRFDAQREELIKVKKLER